ncbi:MAG: hypothetical protein ACYDBQ_02170 [Thermoplasmatota archaeon]
MSRLMSGILIVVFVLVVTIVTATVNQGTVAVSNATGCSATDNYTSCQNVGKSSFLGSLFSTTVTGIKGAPLVVNALYLTVTGIMLATGVLLIVMSFVPLTNE